MAITVGSTLQLVNTLGTPAETGSFIVQNDIGQASILSIIGTPQIGSVIMYYYK